MGAIKALLKVLVSVCFYYGQWPNQYQGRKGVKGKGVYWLFFNTIR